MYSENRVYDNGRYRRFLFMVESNLDSEVVSILLDNKIQVVTGRVSGRIRKDGRRPSV